MDRAVGWFERNRDQLLKVVYWTVVVAVLAAFLAVCLHAIASPWRWGHNGYNGASYSQAARNSIRFGVMAQAKYYTGLEVPPVDEYFTHHPMMIHFHLIAAFKLFGVDELVGRSVPALYSFLSAILLFIMVRRYFGRAMGLATLIAYVLIPINLIYANMIDHEQGSIFWCLAMILAYIRWKESLHWVYFLLTMIATSISVQFGWPGYFVALVLVIHAFLAGARKQTRVFEWHPEYTFTVIFSIVVLGNAYLFYNFIVDLRGDFSEMAEAFLLRSSSPDNYALSLWRYTLDLQGPILVVILAIWVLSLSVRTARWQVHLGDLIPFSFLFAQVVQSLVFKQAGAIHAYWTYHASPVLAVGAAAVVLGLFRVIPRALHEMGRALPSLARRGDARLERGSRRLGWAMSAAIVAVLLAAQARYAYTQFWWGFETGAAAYNVTYDDQYLDIQWVRHVTERYDRTNTNFVLPEGHEWRVEFLYYLDSPYQSTSSTALRPRSDERRLVYLIDLNRLGSRRHVSTLAHRFHTMVYDRRFVVIDVSDESGELEAYVHETQPAPWWWRWLVNPDHPPLRWIPDPEPEEARALFQMTVDIVDEAEFGGSGGSPVEWDCPTGHVLSGLTVVVADDFSQIQIGRVQPSCRPLRPVHPDEEAEEPQRPYRLRHAMPGFGTPISIVSQRHLSCGPGQAIVGIHGKSSHFPNALGIICADVNVTMDPAPGGEVTVEVGDEEWSTAMGGQDGEDFSFVCPAGSIGYGFRGRVGFVTDAVGISCAEINRGFWGRSTSVEAIMEEESVHLPLLPHDRTREIELSF